MREMEAVVGRHWLFTSPEDVALYRDAYSPFWGEAEERTASAAVAPASTEEVQKLVRIAAAYGVPLYPISTGRNLGYGGSAPAQSGSVVLDLKRMNRIIQVDEHRQFAIVEPGVSYFDLYHHLQERGLKVWIDVPAPGWGSVIGNALDRGAGTLPGLFRDHFLSHCGLEVVLPNGELIRTGMGAMPGSDTWAEFKYGYGPEVDGLFCQSNFGVVTKMGIWLYPEPEAYLSGLVTVARRSDIEALIQVATYIEAFSVTVQYNSPLRAAAAGDPKLAALLARHDDAAIAELETYAAERNIGVFSCSLGFYGPEEVNAAYWAFTRKAMLRRIPDAKFTVEETLRFPLTDEQKKALRFPSAVGVPTLQTFSMLSDNPVPNTGHVYFSAVFPKTAAALFEAQAVISRVFEEMDTPSPVGLFHAPSGAHFRCFMIRIGLLTSHDPEHNRKVRRTLHRLIEVCAAKGWGEYRAPPVTQDAAAAAYGFNNHSLMRFTETLKDAVDPAGIISPGRAGIWPRRYRAQGGAGRPSRS